MSFDGNGGMNFKPEQKHIFPELFPEISSLTPTV
jgi:hypothetical protein